MRTMLLGLLTLACCATLCAQTPASTEGWRFESDHEALWRTRANIESFNGRLWTFGGSLASGAKLSIWSSSDGVDWVEEVKDQPWNHNRSAAASVVHDGQMWFTGGSAGGNTFFSSVWVTPDGVYWTEVVSSAPWVTRAYHQALSFNGRMWIIGGVRRVSTPQGPMFVYLNDVWSSEDGANWRLEVAAADWSARSSHGSVVFNGRMWVIGGNYHNDVWSSSDGVHWKLETTAPWEGRAGHATYVYAGRVWVIGGYVFDVTQNWSDDVSDAWSSADGTHWRYEGEVQLDQKYGLGGPLPAVGHLGRLYLATGSGTLWSYGIHFRGDSDLPWGVLDAPYSAVPDVHGGEAPFTVTVIDGALPPGLGFAPSTAQAPLTITGVPEEVGNFTFTLRIEEAGGGEFVEETFSIRIHATTPFSATSNGGGCVLGSVPPGPAALALLCAVTAILRRRKQVTRTSRPRKHRPEINPPRQPGQRWPGLRECNRPLSGHVPSA